MSNHNPFNFIKDRLYSEPPSESDFSDFDLYRVNTAASMSRDYRVVNALSITNSMRFSHLPKHTQCWAFTSFDGIDMSGRWALPKKTKLQEYENLISKIMFVFDCSHSQATSMVDSNLIDIELLESTYGTLTDMDEKIRIKK